LLNLNSSGRLDFATATIPETDEFRYDPTAGSNIVLWTSTAPADYALDMGGVTPLATYGETYTPLHAESNALMVMPQATVLGRGTGDYDTAFYVVLDVAHTDGRTIRPIYLAVKDVKGGERGIVFEAGRQYTFNININSTDAAARSSFDLDVSEWNARSKE
jgi:hypothetical protein